MANFTFINCLFGSFYSWIRVLGNYDIILFSLPLIILLTLPVFCFLPSLSLSLHSNTLLLSLQDNNSNGSVTRKFKQWCRRQNVIDEYLIDDYKSSCILITLFSFSPSLVKAGIAISIFSLLNLPCINFLVTYIIKA